MGVAGCINGSSSLDAQAKPSTVVLTASCMACPGPTNPHLRRSRGSVLEPMAVEKGGRCGARAVSIFI